MQGKELSISIRTKLYFVIFFLFVSFVALIIHNAFIDNISVNYTNANGAGIFRPHIGNVLEELDQAP